MRSKTGFCLLVSLAFFLNGISPAHSAAADGGETAGNLLARPAIVDWHSVESDDYLAYVKNLETIGCSAQTIRTIVTADVIAAFAGKRAEAVTARFQNFQYWQANPDETKARAELAARRRGIDEEMNRVLQQLLGPETDLPDVSREWQRETWNQELNFLTSKKRDATVAILQQYERVNQQMKELAGGANLTEDTNALQRILQQSREEKSTLETVLSPTEYRQVALTTSWTAENLRHALVHFEPTPAEFDIIFDAWKPLDDKLSTIHALRQPDPGNLEQEAYAKIKSQLSASRYQQYCDTWWK
jgi:hypothetical protein